jgi:alkylation response protein AidB-like acyl-CoA dehydrogenase
MLDVRRDEPEEWALMRQSIKTLLARMAPPDSVRQWDEDRHYPEELFQVLAEQGYYAMPFSPELGGSGAGPEEMAVVGEELGRLGMDIAAGFGVTTFLGLTLQAHGTPEQQHRYLRPMIAGASRMSISITEPNAGSDAAAIATSARRVNDGYVLNGQKVFTTGAGLPNTTLLVTARDSSRATSGRSISTFLVPATAAGVKLRRLNTVGRHILGTYEIFYDDVFVPDVDVLGSPGDGWRVLKNGLDLERLFSCAAYVGSFTTVLELAIDYVTTRKQFGSTLAQFQAVSHPLADMYCDLEAARLLTYSAARRLAKGLDARRDISAAKLFVTEAYQRGTSHAMQVMGGYGYVKDYDMQRYWKDARIATISAGTSQIQRKIICGELGMY